MLHTPLPAPGPRRDALAHAIEALDAAELSGASAAARVAALTEVGRCYVALQAFDTARSYLLQALRWAQCLGAADAGTELLCELAELAALQADALARSQPRAAHRAREQARDHAFEAAQRARRAADAHWEVHVLLRASDVLDRFGDHDDAIALQCRALQLLVSDELPALDAEPPRQGSAMLM